jgi:hypothetical protein
MNVRRSPLEALLDNVNVEAMVEIPSPEEVQERLPLTDTAAETILNGRNAIRAILERKDPRLFVVVGPCSIHDPAAALEYAARLRRLADEVRDTLVSSCACTSRSRALRSAGRDSSTIRAWTIRSASTRASCVHESC